MYFSSEEEVEAEVTIEGAIVEESGATVGGNGATVGGNGATVEGNGATVEGNVVKAEEEEAIVMRDIGMKHYYRIYVFSHGH